MNVPFQTDERLHRHRRVAWCGFPLRPLVGHITDHVRNSCLPTHGLKAIAVTAATARKKQMDLINLSYRFDVGLRNLVDN